MALNRHESGDSDRDARLDALYARTRREAPRTEIDDAVRAAARKAIGSRPRGLGAPLRRWGVPISIAAVVVVSVTLVNLMREEGAGHFEEGYSPSERAESNEKPADAPVGGTVRETLEVPKPARQAPTVIPQAPPAPAAEAGAASTAEEPRMYRRSTAPAGIRPAPTEARPGEMGESMADKDQKAPAPQPAPMPQSTGKKPAAGAVGGLGESESQLGSAPARTDRPRVPVQAPKKSERSQMDDRVAKLASALNEADPKSWLEKIQALRREGQDEEADALIAEFKRRFPAYPLPQAEADRLR